MKRKKKVVEVGPGLNPKLPKKHHNKVYLQPTITNVFKKRFPNLKIIKGTAQKMPFEPNSIDKIEMNNVLSAPRPKTALKLAEKEIDPNKQVELQLATKVLFEGNREKAIKQVHKVLKSGGKLVLTNDINWDKQRFDKIIKLAVNNGFRLESRLKRNLKLVRKTRYNTDKVVLIKK